MSSNNTPAPRIGDVIMVPAGAAYSYRAAFRMRVESMREVDYRGMSIMAGTLVNKDGSTRKGNAERHTEIDPRKCVVEVPTPATDAEITDAYAEHNTREIERTRCDHLPTEIGCEHVDCMGVPPVTATAGAEVQPIASERPTPAEYGTQTWARTFRDTLRGYPLPVAAEMPRVVCMGRDHWGNVVGRRYMVTETTVRGHSVHVVEWETRRYAPVTSIMFDGALINADVNEGRGGMTPAERSRMVAWRVADALRTADADEIDAENRAQVDAIASYAPPTMADADGTPVALGDAVESIHATGAAGIVSATPRDGYAMIMWAGDHIVETGARGDALRALPADVIPAGTGSALVTRCRALWDATRPNPAPVTWAEPDAGTPVDLGDAPAEPSDTHGCPIASINAYGRFGHRTDCPDHAETTDKVHAEPALHTVTESETTMSDAPATATPAQVSTVATPARSVPLVVSVDRDALADALNLAVWSTPRRPSVPVLAGVMLRASGDRLTLETFDYEVSASSALPADVTTPGHDLVDAKALRDMVRKFPKVKATRGKPRAAGAGMVKLESVGNMIMVHYGAVRLTLPTMPAEDYPTMPETGAPVAQVAADVLAASVARIVRAAGRDDTLPVLTGVKLTTDADGRTASLDATDRYRLAAEDMPWSPIVPDGMPAQEWIAPALIPAATLAQVGKVFAKTGDAVTVSMTHTQGYSERVVIGVAGTVAFTCGGTTITTRTLDGDFPKVRALLPAKYAGTGYVNARNLADVIERVAQVAEPSMPVRLTWADGTVTAAVGGSDGPSASETLPAEGDVTDGFTIAFNHAYLIDGLRAFPAGTAGTLVTFGMTETKKPAVIASDDVPGFRYLIMPVRVGGDGGSKPAGSAPVEMPAPAPAPEPVAETDAETDAPTRPAPAVTATHLRRIRAALAGSGLSGYKVSNHSGHVITIKNGRIGIDRLREITGIRYLESAPEASAMGGVYVRYTPDPTTTPAPVAQVTPAPAPVPATESEPTVSDTPATVPAAPSASVTPAPVAPAYVAPAVPDTVPADMVARVADILRMGLWTTDVVKVGKGSDRRSLGVTVLTLNSGRLDYRGEYVPVRDVIRTLGGAWNKAARGFAFEASTAQFSGGYSASGADKVTAWCDRHAQVDAEPVADVPAEPVAQVDAEPVAQVDAEPVADRAMGVGDHVTIAGVNGNGEPLTLSGYVTAEPVDTGRRGVRVMVAETPGGRGRPVYVRDMVGALPAGIDAADVHPVDAEPVAAPTIDTVERIADESGAALQAGDFARAGELAAQARALAPVGYLVAGFITFDAIDAAIADAAQAAQVAAEPVAEPIAVVTPVDVETVAQVATEPIAEPVELDAADADALTVAQVAAVPAVVAAEPVPAVVDADGSLGYTLAAYAESVNGGRGYKASRKAVHAALRAAKIKAVVHAVESNRRGMRVECDAADRARVAAIIAETVTATVGAPTLADADA